MSNQTPVDKTSPLWLAWLAYSQTEEYANSLKWSKEGPGYVEGSLWAAFAEGFARAGSPVSRGPTDAKKMHDWKPRDKGDAKRRYPDGFDHCSKCGKPYPENVATGEFQEICPAAPPSDTPSDSQRLNWLQCKAWAPDVGNGLALFPYRSAASGGEGINITELGDEDGSDLGDDIADGPTLREAIDAAMRQKDGS